MIKVKVNRLKVEELIKDQCDTFSEWAELHGYSKANLSKIINAESLHIKTIRNLAGELGVDVEEIMIRYVD